MIVSITKVAHLYFYYYYFYYYFFIFVLPNLLRGLGDLEVRVLPTLLDPVRLDADDDDILLDLMLFR